MSEKVVGSSLSRNNRFTREMKRFTRESDFLWYLVLLCHTTYSCYNGSTTNIIISTCSQDTVLQYPCPTALKTTHYWFRKARFLRELVVLVLHLHQTKDYLASHVIVLMKPCTVPLSLILKHQHQRWTIIIITSLGRLWTPTHNKPLTLKYITVYQASTEVSDLA